MPRAITLRALMSIASFLILAACSSPTDVPGPFNATAVFTITSTGESEASPVTSHESVVYVSVAKAGRKTLVNAWGDDVREDERYARHKFPPHCGAKSIVAYFSVIIAKAGWQQGTDYRVSENSITFLGVTKLECGSDQDEIRIHVTREKIQ